jgi:hypothetical protein
VIKNNLRKGQRIKKVHFPAGMDYKQGEFGTTVTGYAFSILHNLVRGNPGWLLKMDSNHEK